MGGVGKVVVAVLIILALLAILALQLRAAMQHQAVYPGPLTFVGTAKGPLDAHYHRVFLWRPTDATEPLPPLTVHLAGTAYTLDELTPALFAKFGSRSNEGALYDATGTILQYRFEDNRLTWFSLDASRPRTLAPGGNTVEGEIAMSRGGGGRVTLPVSLVVLREKFGAPQETALVFRQ